MRGKWDQKLYKKTAAFQHQLGMKLIERTLSLYGDESILDVGCGDGFLTKNIASMVPQGNVVGIDSSEEMIQHALSTYKNSNLSFKCVKVENIDFKKQFDYVVSFNAIMWVKDQPKALQNIYQSLKYSGKLIILLWPWTDFYWLPAELVRKSEKWEKHFPNFSNEFQCFDVSGYRLLLELTGFQVDQVENVFHDLRYETTEQYASTICSFLPHFSYIEDPKKQKDLLNDICKQYSMIAGKDHKGHCFGPTRHIEVVAVKR